MPIIVSDAAAEESLQAYTNPLSIQAKALDDLSEKVLNGDVVSDGNNPFTFLTEFASNMTANIVNTACECFNGLYPLNAQNATELYRHLSDFDYVGLYATPATTSVELIFDRNFLIEQAIDTSDEDGFNEDPAMISGVYSKIIIPAYSKFNVGDYVFGLMYPIEIRVRKAIKDGQIDYMNSAITVNWDTSKNNPLMTLNTHILEHRDFVQDGQMLTAIEVPIYQFEVANHLEESIGATGFAKRYDFTNKFYAIRVFHFKNGAWNELAQTFSDTKYDPDIPTAIVKVLTDLNKVEVVVPHVYFNSTTATTVIGKRILVKVYTTQGEINVDLSEYRVEQFQASFLLTDTNLVEDDRYSNMLKRIPTVYILPLSTRISSGTNGLTFDQLKNRVKYNNSYTVKITPTDLQNYFNTSGYKFTKELDNITDRVYCAHKLLKDGTGSPIASGQGLTYLTETALDIQRDQNDNLYVPGYSTLTVVDENTITILPSSVYKYNESEDRFYLLSDAEKAALDDPDLKTKVNNYNSNLYTYSPFHTVLSYDSASPIAGTYDMYKPVIKDRKFVWENTETTVGLSIYNATIESDPDGGYILKVSIFKTANIADVPAYVSKSTIDNFMLMLSSEGKGNLTYYLFGKHYGVDTSGRDVYIFYLKSDFKITTDGYVFINSMHDGMEDADEDAHGGYIAMGFHDYTLSLCMLDDTLENYVETGFNKSNTIDFNLPAELDKYTLLCQQSFKLKLGESLPLLQNNVAITTSDEEYATYQTTQFATYQATVYDRYTIQDAIDGICTQDDIGKLKLDENDKLIPKHIPGDVILSSQYDVCYGPTITMTNGDVTDTLELVNNDDRKITSTSDPSNLFASVSGDLFVQCKQYPELTGMYKVVDRSKTGTDRVWKHQFNTIGELFDTSEIVTPMIYYGEDEDGVHVSLADPYSEYIAVADEMRFYSSNSMMIKNCIQGITPLKDVNTSARDYDRKWFFVGNSPLSFDFEMYTGFVIEYGYSGISTSGTVMSWVLNYYYLDVGEDGDAISQCITLAENLDLDGTILDEEAQEILQHDPYVSGCVASFHEIHYRTDDGVTWLELEDLYRGRCVLTEGSYGVITRKEPWDVIWKPTDEDVTEIPTVTCLSTTDMPYQIYVEDAMQFIDENIYPDTVGAFKLYRNIENIEEQNTTDPLEVLEDPLKGYMFVAVLKCDDNRQIDEFNYIDYAPGYGDETGISNVELGTTTAEGAIYYRDIAMTNYDPYSEDHLSATDIAKIFMKWSESHKDGESDTIAYDKIIKEYSSGINKISVPLTYALLRKIISSSAPSFMSPWVKLTTCSSRGAISDYVQYRQDPYNNDGYAGYVGVLKATDVGPYHESEVVAFTMLSNITRSIVKEESSYEDTAFYINPANLTWNEIDKWPWEYTTPWIDLTTMAEADIDITYNTAMSSTTVLYGNDTVIMDEDGNPLVATPRALNYGVSMIHCDYKLSLSEDAEYQFYMEDVRELLRSYFNELETITPSLLARTKLYFSPIRTFGSAEFKGSNGSTQILPVQFSAELGLHIEAYVKDSTLSKQTIREVILSLIDKDMKDGTINLSALAKDIIKELSDNVLYVDVLGLNGNKAQQTMIPVNENTYPQLKQILVLYEDGTIHVDRDLELNWYVIT